MLPYSSSAGTMNVLAVTSRTLLSVSRAMTLPIRLRVDGSARVFSFVSDLLLIAMARLWHHPREHKTSEAKIAVITQQLTHSDKS